jgi:hypothetical protein
MAYADIYAAANDATFQGRCQVAMWTAAQNIAAEAANTPNHQARIDWSTRVLQDRANITPRQLAMQVLRNATIAANPSTSTDGDLQFQVNSVIADIITIG